MVFSNFNNYKQYIKWLIKTPPFIVYIILLIGSIIYFSDVTRSFETPLWVKQLLMAIVMLNSVWQTYYYYKYYKKLKK